MVSPGEVNLWYLSFLLGCFEPMSGLITVYTSKVKKKSMEGDVESQNNFFPSAWETSLQHMCSKHQREDLNFQSTSSWVKWLHGSVFQMPIWKNLSGENNLYSVLQILKMLRDGRGVKILSAIKTWIIMGKPFCDRGGLILEIQASADSWMLRT